MGLAPPCRHFSRPRHRCPNMRCHCQDMPPPFSELADPATAAARWKSWIRRLDHYFVGMRETDGRVKRSLLMCYGGAELYDLFETLPNTGTDDNYEEAVAALNRHFDP